MMDVYECGKVSLNIIFFKQQTQYIQLSIILFFLLSFTVNYLKQWKCAAVLKQDGQSPQDSSNNAAITTPNTTLATTKYYKRGNLSHPNEVLLH